MNTNENTVEMVAETRWHDWRERGHGPTWHRTALDIVVPFEPSDILRLVREWRSLAEAQHGRTYEFLSLVGFSRS